MFYGGVTSMFLLSNLEKKNSFAPEDMTQTKKVPFVSKILVRKLMASFRRYLRSENNCRNMDIELRDESIRNR